MNGARGALLASGCQAAFPLKELLYYVSKAAGRADTGTEQNELLKFNLSFSVFL